MAWAAVGAAAIGAAGSLYSSKQSKKSAQAGASQTQQIDPRFANLLYGDGKDTAGLANLLYGQGVASTPAGQQFFGQGLDSYLGGWGTDNFMRSQQAAQGLQGSDIAAPQITKGYETPPMGDAARVGQAWTKAPSQNNLDLSAGFNDFIYGEAGANPYLTGAIQKGINQSNAAFGNYLTDAKKSTQDLLGGIRGGAIASGQYGSSRQGLAEGKALDSFSTNISRAASQFGQNNTDAAVAAQAGAYDADRNRSLSALTNLSGQQYATAAHDADLWQRTNEQNAMYYQDAQKSNQAAALATNQLNAGIGQANLGAQIDTNRLNSQNRTAGIGLSSSLLGQAYGMGQSTSNATLDRLGRASGYLAPYSGLGGTTTSTQPYYSNSGGNALGGVAAGLSLWNQFGGMFGGSGSSGAPSNQLF